MAIRLEVEETFAAPPERVFAALSDPEQVAAWMPGFVRFERLGGPAFGKGTRLRETRKMFGREASEVFEVVACDPPRSFEFYIDGKQGSSKCGEYRFRYELRPAAGGTALRMSGEFGGMGWFMSLVGRLFAGSFRKACRKDLAALKARLERRKPATS